MNDITPEVRIARWLAEARKALAALLGVLGLLVANQLLPAPYDAWATAVIGALTPLVVYSTKNAPKPGDDGEAGPDYAELDVEDAAAEDTEPATPEPFTSLPD